MKEIEIDGIPSTPQKMKFSIKGFFSKCDQIRSFLRIWSHLLKKFLMENFIFCALQSRTNLYETAKKGLALRERKKEEKIEEKEKVLPETG